MSGTMGAVRERCGREQRDAFAAASKWGETPAMVFLFAEVDRLELASDEAQGLDGGDDWTASRHLSRCADELLALGETARDRAIDEAVDACEFVDEESDPGSGWTGRDVDEQIADFRSELNRDLPTVEELARAARRAARRAA
jgi:hypothetical protein